MTGLVTKALTFVEASRPLIWLFAIVSSYCGMFMAVKGLPPIHLLIIVAIGVGPCITAATNLINAVFDIEIDRLSKPGRPLPASRISKSSTLTVTAILYGVGLALAFYVGFWPFTLTALGVLLSIFYSIPPTRVKAKGGFSNFALALGYTTVCFLGGWAIFRDVREMPLLILLCVTIQMTGANMVKDFVDYEADKACKIGTLPVKYGASFTMNFILLLFALAYSLIPLFFVVGFWGRIYLPITVLAAWGVLILRSLRRDFSRRNREAMFLQAFCLSLVTEVAFVIAYILA